MSVVVAGTITLANFAAGHSSESILQGVGDVRSIMSPSSSNSLLWVGGPLLSDLLSDSSLESSAAVPCYLAIVLTSSLIS